MPITTQCKKCHREYSVKDELAGKKFRCKQCQTVVQIPQPAVLIEDEPEPEEDLFEDFGSSTDDEDFFGQDFDESFEDDYEPVRRPKKKKRKPAKKKRRKRKNSINGSEILGKFGKLFGIAVAALFVFGFVIRLFNAAGGLGAIDLGTSWKAYNTPDGNITVMMPGDPKSVPVAQMAAGGQSVGVMKRSFACILVMEPMPAVLNGMTDEEIFDAFEMGSLFVGAENVGRSQIQGRPCVTFDKTAPGGIKSKNLAFVYKNRVYTLNYAYKGFTSSGSGKFLDSVEFH